MTDRVQILAVICSVALLALILELVRRRRLAEEYSAVWILSSIVLFVVSLRRDILHATAAWLGVHYPPAVLLLVVIGMVTVASLSFSVILSRQQRQIDRLIEENAILSAQMRELQADSAPREREASAPKPKISRPA